MSLNWTELSNDFDEVITLCYYKKVTTPGKYSYHQGRREQREIGGGFQNWCDEGIEAEEPVFPFEGNGDVLGVFQTLLKKAMLNDLWP